MTTLSSILNEADAGRAPQAALVASEHGAVTLAEVSDTVLAVDRWGRRRGEALSEEWHELTMSAGVYGEPYAATPDGETWPPAPPDPIDPSVAADAHASLFEPAPKPVERPKDASRAAWWRQLMETPEYASLRSQTVLDAGLSGLASKVLCDQWLAYAATQEPKSGDPATGGSATGDPGTGDKPAPGSEGESIADQVARIRSTSKALAEAADMVDTAGDMAAGLGMSGVGSSLDQAKLAEYFRLVRSDETLRKILQFAGRAIRRCRALQRTKLTADRGELTGVELGGDVARLVPWEACQVSGAVPELETLALLRLAQHRSLCYRQQRTEPTESGPIVIVVDESGSMDGEKIIAAKGIALAMAWLARQQKRWCALVGFSGGTNGNRLACPPNVVDQAAVIDWVTHFYGGGTTLDVPLVELPTVYWAEFMRQGMPRGKTDVIIVTDAIVNADDEMVASYRRWAAAESVSTFGIVIGRSVVGDFERVCDRYWAIKELSLDSQAVEEVLSI